MDLTSSLANSPFCEECHGEIVDFPESRGLCRRCEANILEHFKTHTLPLMTYDQRIRIADALAVELISRGTFPE